MKGVLLNVKDQVRRKLYSNALDRVIDKRGVKTGRDSKGNLVIVSKIKFTNKFVVCELKENKNSKVIYVTDKNPIVKNCNVDREIKIENKNKILDLICK